ncbi:TlpA family protein disulfide reductase [Mucilaginibacter sp. 21P]|uniref:TlpA family protein disulfide reductase n=1 Tax=Mucilaginibacter sp. 21P TaxID=2778902 RepID=UPI001C588961|nr:TlpA disulfide reductase family protein [Mucilaginibacter sp. 21P]QXV66842.1 TlpA family protein disulfide reductase [Mucilaginibacter sp. 21P]
MKKSILLSVLAALCLFGSVKGQQTTGLQTGDQVPDLLMTNVIYSPQNPLKLSDYKGKLLLLDFWASWCSSCIENLPRIEGIAAKYKDRFAVLGVDDEPRAKIEQFFKTKSHNGQPYEFTTTYADTTLRKWFPHQTIPHCVWIAPNGTVIAITGAAEVTEQSVLAALDKHPLQLTTKKDIDPQQPLFLNQWFTADSLQSYFLYVKGSYPGTGTSSPVRIRGKDTIGQAFTNMDVLTMYETTATRQLKKWGENYNTKRLLLETPDSTKLRLENHQVRYVQSNPSPYANNVDMIVPRSQKDSVFLLLLKALNQATGYQARLEKRMTTVLALQRTGKDQELISKGGSPVYLQFNQGPAKATNQPISAIIARLNSLPEIKPLITDETGISTKVDLTFSGKTDLKTINEDLERQGLRLTPRKVMLNRLVISGHAKN